MKTEPSDGPVYLQALLPAKEDDTGPENAEDNLTSGAPSEEVGTKGGEAEQMETNTSDMDRTMDSMESYENPFLKAPKRIKH